jgi:hypothetical protein
VLVLMVEYASRQYNMHVAACAHASAPRPAPHFTRITAVKVHTLCDVHARQTSVDSSCMHASWAAPPAVQESSCVRHANCANIMPELMRNRIACCPRVAAQQAATLNIVDGLSSEDFKSNVQNCELVPYA